MRIIERVGHGGGGLSQDYDNSRRRFEAEDVSTCYIRKSGNGKCCLQMLFANGRRRRRIQQTRKRRRWWWRMRIQFEVPLLSESWSRLQLRTESCPVGTPRHHGELRAADSGSWARGSSRGEWDQDAEAPCQCRHTARRSRTRSWSRRGVPSSDTITTTRAPSQSRFRTHIYTHTAARAAPSLPPHANVLACMPLAGNMPGAHRGTTRSL